ncbi:MAG TPA: UbiA family prenyltransferase [Actinomycetota bacterium]|nr:UbiA family prenyltransferase [Actinomycetota bacterium]
MIGAARLLIMMIRPPVAVVLMLFASIGLALGGRANGFHPLLTSVFLIVGGWFIHATVLNDLADEEIDRVNLRDARGRPLVSGDATRAQLMVLGLSCGAVALVASWLVNWRVGAVVSVGLVLNAAYSLKPLQLSHRGMLAVALLPLGYVALPFLVGVFSAKAVLEADDMVVLVGLYVTFMGRIVLKDFRDEGGDRLFGKRTFLIRHGREQTAMFSAACWIVGSATLIAVVPPQSVLFADFVAYLVCVLHGLFLLVRTDGHTAQQVVIGAVAQAGRGMGLNLLAHFIMMAERWSRTDQALVHLSVVAVFVYMYIEMVARRETTAPAAIRPF